MKLYLGTILLEPSRWKAGAKPLVTVSEWLPKITDAGFDGIELWERHWTVADEAEREKIARAKTRVAVFNTYATFETPDSPALRAAADAIRRLKPDGVKFNLGKDAATSAMQAANAIEWAQGLPKETRLLCECHAGTVMETPAGAAKVFATWPEKRFSAIVHAFQFSPENLKSWLDALGGRVAHVHVQARDAKGVMERLDRRPDEQKRAIGVLKDARFSGTWTLEFAEGTSTKDDLPEILFQNALRDRDFLVSQDRKA